MPIVDVVPVVCLVALLAVAFRHPRGTVEAAAGLVAVVAVVLVGDLDLGETRAALHPLLPVVGFLCAVLVVAERCASEGLFVALGSSVERLGRGRPVRLLGLGFLAAALVTALLSLDATVVLLTPVLAGAAAGLPRRPVVFACVRLANAASLLLPVSNLTNLLAMPRLRLDFLEFAALMAPTWVAVISVEYAAHRWFFRDQLRQPCRPPVHHDVGTGAAGPTVAPVAFPRFATTVVVLMLVGFALGSAVGLAPVWPTSVAAATVAVRALAQGRTDVRALVASAHLGFGIFVLCLGVVVAALGETFLGDAVGDLVPDEDTLPALLLVALLATVLANLVNNLPATLLLVPVVAPLGTAPLLAALVGLGAGSSLTMPGSLANLLWRRVVLRRRLLPPEGLSSQFHRLSLLTTPLTVLAGVLVLAGWTSLLHYR